MTTPNSILVEVREWHDKTYGNTYWSSRVWVDGEVLFALPFQYGYGDHSVFASINELVKREVLTPECKPYSMRQINDLGIDFYYTKSKALRREMFKEMN
jgi:hypothetical protein